VEVAVVMTNRAIALSVMRRWDLFTITFVMGAKRFTHGAIGWDDGSVVLVARLDDADRSKVTIVFDEELISLWKLALKEAE
jgi:hypothetical protein